MYLSYIYASYTHVLRRCRLRAEWCSAREFDGKWFEFRGSKKKDSFGRIAEPDARAYYDDDGYIHDPSRHPQRFDSLAQWALSITARSVSVKPVIFFRVRRRMRMRREMWRERLTCFIVYIYINHARAWDTCRSNLDYYNITN